MKIKDAINMANLMENGNVMPKELAILFLSELDGMIQSDIMLHAPEEIVSYTDEEQELILRPPHDKLYVHYLVMMIRNQQQEYEGYQNSQESVNEKLKTFRRWYISHYRPADTGSRSYTGGTSADAFGFAYLTAYGLAVKHGYQGTEEEWLESLNGEKGNDGAAARMRYDPEREMIQWGVGDSWYDLFTLAELRDPAVAAFLAEAQASAEVATQAAQDAKDSQRNVARIADNVEGLEANAKVSAQEAAGSASRAQHLADGASAAAQSAANSAGRAEEAAQRAEEAAASGGAGGGGIAEETDPTVPEWAKQSNKPTYTAEEVGAEPVGRASVVVNSHNNSQYAHGDIRRMIESLTGSLGSYALKSAIPDKVSQLQNDSGYLTSAPVSSVNGKTGAVQLSAADVGAMSESGANGIIVNLLDEAKKSGDFDGDPGRGIQSIARTGGNGAAGALDTYTITYTDGTTGTYQVRNGADGADGDDGITPHIGGNGNWYLGDADTGVTATGPQGPAYTLTDADKQSITAAVVAALPKYAGEVEAV